MLTLTPTVSSFSTTDSPTLSSSPPPPLSPSPAPAPTPDCLFPTPSLPPSTRDFEIHRLALVELLSTRRIAEKFRISQTRVRQIIARVADWITEMLPIKSEQEIEKEKNYAIHLAAAQLQNQIEHLRYSWDASSDPKYQRQMTRTIIALARLGVSYHHLDALADNVVADNSVQRPDGQAAEHDLHSPAPSQFPNPQSQIPNSSSSSFSIHPSAFPSPPPPGDCSPAAPQASSSKPQAFPTTDENPFPTIDLYPSTKDPEETMKGFKIFEQRLLTLIDQTYPEQTERLHSLQNTLAEVREEKANFILQLGPNHPVVLQTQSGPGHPLCGSAPQVDKLTHQANSA